MPCFCLAFVELAERLESVLLFVHQLLDLRWHLFLDFSEDPLRVRVSFGYLSQLASQVLHGLIRSFELSVKHFLDVDALEEFVLQNLFSVVLGAQSF